MLGLPQSQSSSSGGSAKAKPNKETGKRRKAEEGLEEFDDAAEIQEVIGLVGRLSMQAASKADAAMGIMLDVCLVSMDYKVKIIGAQDKETLPEAMKRVMRMYAEETKNMAPGAKAMHGPPHLRAWDTCLMWTMKFAEEAGETEMVKILKEHEKEVTTVPAGDKVRVLGDSVRYCRVDRAHNRGQMRVEMNVKNTKELLTTQDTWACMRKIFLVNMKGEARSGKAPPNALQRKVLAKLKQMGLMDHARSED
eukprot:TRINITY_DN42314_c0_g1_i1.p2 TRINITY_DN42314_c0_g1~~TRINITY_DN42314_c0_g1_i1.p2  ORF type:complete len:251 (-),score=101.80 TRINITY_DN42314_c0_g1_i1:261-1013(-)